MVVEGKSSSNQTILHTRSYTLEEVILLQKVLTDNFKLRTLIYEKTIGQWIIIIHVKQEISLIKNIPYNTNYKGLGSFIPSNIKAGNYKIIDVIFDDNINYIIVNQLNFNVTEVSIFYKDSKTLIFTDSISKKDKIERCYGSGEVVYFEENMPFFFFDENIQKPVYKKDEDGNFTKERIDIIKPIKSPLIPVIFKCFIEISLNNIN